MAAAIFRNVAFATGGMFRHMPFSEPCPSLAISKQGQARNPKAKCRQTHKTQCSCLQTRSVSEITSRVMLILSFASLATFVPHSPTRDLQLTWTRWKALARHRHAQHTHTHTAFDLLALEPFEFHLSDFDYLRLA